MSGACSNQDLRQTREKKEKENNRKGNGKIKEYTLGVRMAGRDKICLVETLSVSLISNLTASKTGFAHKVAVAHSENINMGPVNTAYLVMHKLGLTYKKGIGKFYKDNRENGLETAQPFHMYFLCY